MKIEDARRIGAEIVGEDGDVETLMEHGPDAIEALLAHVDGESERIAAAVAAERAAIVAQIRAESERMRAGVARAASNDGKAGFASRADALRAMADTLAAGRMP